jgi:hypothetical protein
MYQASINTPINSESSTPGSNTPRTPPAEAQKVLTLASESSNMLKSISSIFTQAVDGAEMVLGRRDVDIPEGETPTDMDLA